MVWEGKIMGKIEEEPYLPSFGWIDFGVPKEVLLPAPSSNISLIPSYQVKGFLTPSSSSSEQTLSRGNGHHLRNLVVEWGSSKSHQNKKKIIETYIEAWLKIKEGEKKKRASKMKIKVLVKDRSSKDGHSFINYSMEVMQGI